LTRELAQKIEGASFEQAGGHELGRRTSPQACRKLGDDVKVILLLIQAGLQAWLALVATD